MSKGFIEQLKPTPSDQVRQVPVEEKNPVAVLPSATPPQRSQRSEVPNNPSGQSPLLPPLLGSNSPTDDATIYTAGQAGVTSPQITFKPKALYSAEATKVGTQGVVAVCLMDAVSGP